MRTVSSEPPTDQATLTGELAQDFPDFRFVGLVIGRATEPGCSVRRSARGILARTRELPLMRVVCFCRYWYGRLAQLDVL